MRINVFSAVRQNNYNKYIVLRKTAEKELFKGWREREREETEIEQKGEEEREKQPEEDTVRETQREKGGVGIGKSYKEKVMLSI